MQEVVVDAFFYEGTFFFANREEDPRTPLLQRSPETKALWAS
jgi:hypothetical protein